MKRFLTFSFIILLNFCLVGCEKGEGACTYRKPGKKGDPYRSPNADYCNTAFWCENNVQKQDCPDAYILTDEGKKIPNHYWDDKDCKDLGYKYPETGNIKEWYGPSGKYPYKVTKSFCTQY